MSPFALLLTIALAAVGWAVLVVFTVWLVRGAWTYFELRDAADAARKAGPK